MDGREYSFTRRELEVLQALMRYRPGWTSAGRFNSRIYLTDSEREQMLNILADDLQRSGFDSDYAISARGAILEAIIDKLSSHEER